MVNKISMKQLCMLFLLFTPYLSTDVLAKMNKGLKQQEVDSEDAMTRAPRNCCNGPDSTTRSHHCKVCGVICVVNDPAEDVYVPFTERGTGFQLINPAGADADGQNVFEQVGLSYDCNTGCFVGPFQTRQSVVSGRVKFDEPFKHKPVVLATVQADQTANTPEHLSHFATQGYFGDDVVLNSLSIQIRDVDKDGFSFDLILVLYGTSQLSSINDTLMALWPNVCFHFVAEPC